MPCFAFKTVIQPVNATKAAPKTQGKSLKHQRIPPTAGKMIAKAIPIGAFRQGSNLRPSFGWTPIRTERLLLYKRHQVLFRPQVHVFSHNSAAKIRGLDFISLRFTSKITMFGSGPARSRLPKKLCPWVCSGANGSDILAPSLNPSGSCQPCRAIPNEAQDT